jgi:hypothetical protein
MEVETPSGRMGALRAFLTQYEWAHILIGVAGNILFLTGSILFGFTSLQTYAIACFIAGSSGMLVAAVADAIVRVRRSRVR